ncbi:MAG TPA: hypothetical protein VHA12_03800 [Candidatus Nanoarchaeia archaeon]|nr:hypothetical protein [Candidatus Nanoarchaeia archaeon]
MQTFYIDKISDVKANIEELERKLKVKVVIKGKQVTIDSSDGMNEYEASVIFEAIQFGFSVNKALLLTDPDVIFRKINLKDYTRRKDMDEVRGRLIGTHGRTRNTIEETADAEILVGESAVGIICHAESIEKATEAVTNLIKGSKQANVYRFLERMNAEKKKYRGDLGIKSDKKKQQAEDIDSEAEED